MHQVGVRLHGGTSDAPAQLVELGKPEHVRVLDDDRVDIWDVDAVLENGRRHEQIRLAEGE